MTMSMLARSLAGMFPKAVGQIVTSVVAGICIAWATNWLLRTETPPAPVIVVERAAPVADTAPRRPEMPLFLSIGAFPAAAPEARQPAPAHPRAEAEAMARPPQAPLPELHHPVEVATLPPVMGEPAAAPAAQAAPASAEARPQDQGFLGRHVPVAQRGIDLVQDEAAAIVSVITSTLPTGASGANGGGQAATSELY